MLERSLKALVHSEEYMATLRLVSDASVCAAEATMEPDSNGEIPRAPALVVKFVSDASTIKFDEKRRLVVPLSFMPEDIAGFLAPPRPLAGSSALIGVSLPSSRRKVASTATAATVA